MKEEQKREGVREIANTRARIFWEDEEDRDRNEPRQERRGNVIECAVAVQVRGEWLRFAETDER